MGLKKLLTNLSEGVQDYPNHNLPTDGGGFDYGESFTPIFEGQFKQKSFKFGQGTAFDRPNQGFSQEPFITNPTIDILSNNPEAQVTIDNLTDGFVRGGAITHAERLITDVERISNFMATPKGLLFLTKQEGLQLSNPKISAPSVNISRANQRTYNLGINTLAQIGTSGTGIHIKREGLSPLAFEGYADASKLRSNNENNRLIYLFNDKISTSPSGLDTALGFVDDFLGVVGIDAGLGDNELYSYSGGPNSTYGIGQTVIRRYDNTNTGIYSKIRNREQNKIWNSPESSIRKGYNLGEPGIKLSTGDLYHSLTIDQLNLIDVFKSNGATEFPEINDFIPFRFEAVDSNNPVNTDVIAFRAFLEDFTDNFNASHNSFNYNGRGETFYTYNGFTRNIGLSFKIAAQSRHELLPLYRKLNYLISNTAPEYSSFGRMVTPFMRLTVGHWCDRVPGVLNSIGLTWQKDYSWETSKDDDVLILPHVLDVSVQFTPVHDFLPEKGISSPFILPHSTSNLKQNQQWYNLGIEDSPTVDTFKRKMEERARSREQEAITLEQQNINQISNEQNQELIGGPREFQETVTLEQQDISLIPNPQNQELIGGPQDANSLFLGQEDLPYNPNQV